jgi:dihydroxy-acid dehydratase
MLHAIGFNDEDLSKPIVGVAHTWIETMPCNFNQRRLAERVKEGIRAAGGTPMELNTVAISDGVTMGTEGMKASLVSREVIADSIELVGGVTCSTPSSRSSAATRRSRARRWPSSASASQAS